MEANNPPQKPSLQQYQSSGGLSTSITLLERLKVRSDQEAWGRFVALYAPLLFYWARGLGWPPADADDLVQEVLLLLLDKLPTFEHRGAGSFRAWLRTVAVNKCREHCRRNPPPVAARDDRPAIEAQVIAHESDPFWEVEYRQLLVARALEIMRSEFEETTWQVCWQRVVEDRPAAEVSQQFGVSVGAVYVYTGRVLRRLREQLEGVIE